MWLAELEARSSDYARNTLQPGTRHGLTVFTFSKIQLNIFDGGCHGCCAVHTIGYCIQTFGGVGKNILLWNSIYCRTWRMSFSRVWSLLWHFSSFNDLRRKEAYTLFVNIHRSCTELLRACFLMYMTPYDSIISVSNACRLDFITTKTITIYINTWAG